MMRERYFDHDADIGIIGYGPTLESSFADAAHAMFSLMSDLSEVKERETVQFSFEESDIELAFVTWLNLLLAKANSMNCIFSHFEISRKGHQWNAEAKGEKWHDSLLRGTDVKGATLTMLSVKKIDQEWVAKCIVDV